MNDLGGTKQTLLGAALDYAERGWPVFQLYLKDGKLKPKTKTKDGGRRWDATTNPDEIKERWTQDPTAGIGIATGKESGLLVVDVDTSEGHGVDGLASLAALIEQYGELPSTAKASSPSGGGHYYFRYPEDREIGNGSGVIAEGIDHRGNGGFIVAPPSVRPDGEYIWRNPLGLVEPEDCPEWLLDWMEKPKPKLSDRAIASAPRSFERKTGWAEAALNDEKYKLFAAPEGGRNQQLNTSAFNLGQIVAGGGLDQSKVERELSCMAEGIGLERNEIADTVKSGMDAGYKLPRTAPARAIRGAVIASAVQRLPDMTLLDKSRSEAPQFDPMVLFGSDWGNWVKNAAQGAAAPADYTGMTLLSVAGSLIGNARWVSPSKGWQEPPLIWSMLIGNPSAGKTPGAKPVRQPLDDIEHEERERRKEEFVKWEKAEKLHKIKVDVWKQEVKRAIKDEEAPPEEPAPINLKPWLNRLSVSDTTIEAAAQVVERQPKGLLVCRDELAGVLGNLTRYANGGSDGPFYLEGYTGGRFSSERKGSGTIYIPKLSVTLTGTIQPDRLSALLLNTADDGMLARFIPVFPEPVPVAVSEQTVDFDFAKDAMMRLHRLRMVDVDVTNKDAGERPLFVRFTPEALAAMTEFRKHCRKLENDHSGLMLSLIGKLSGMAARVSLVIVYLEWAATDKILGEPSEVDLDGFKRAEAFCLDYILPMALRAYADATIPKAERGAQQLAKLIRDERLTELNSRDVQRKKMHGLRDSKEVKEALHVLTEAHWLTEHKEKTAGAPKTVFLVNPAALA